MKASVLLITYNQEHFIAQAVESVLGQETDFDFEVVIGEDCSTDSTRSIVESYAKRYPKQVRVLTRTENLGACGARNFVDTYHNCTGEYVALHEGDDYWTEPNKLQRQVDALDSHPEWSLCFHNVSRTYVDEDRPDDEFPGANHPRVSDLDDLLERNFIQTCSVVVRNGFVQRFPEWYFLPGPGDWFFCIFHAQRGSIGYLPEAMAKYRVHPGGTWSSKDRDLALAEQDSLFKALVGDLTQKRHRRLTRATASRLTLERALLAAERGDRLAAARHAVRSMIDHPLHPTAFGRTRCAMLCRALAPRFFRWITREAPRRCSQSANPARAVRHVGPRRPATTSRETERV